MAQLPCEKCGQAMALADKQCVKCGYEAPRGRTAQLYLARAKKAAQAADYDTALTFAGKALSAGFLEAEKISALQFKGNWHERRAGEDSSARDWLEAENCFREGLTMDDSSEALHQLWISNLVKADRGKEALDWYAARLAHNPDDEIAQKFHLTAKLTLEYKSQDLTKVYQSLPQGQTRLEKLFEPTRTNIWGTGISGTVCALAAVMLKIAGYAGKNDNVILATFLDPLTWGIFSFGFFVLFGVLRWYRA